MTGFAGADCHLSILARDEETSMALKKRIAGFLGLPSVEELPKLRNVIEKLFPLHHVPFF